MQYIGVDYHKDTAVVCVQTTSGKTVDEFIVPATIEGMDQMIARIKSKKFKVMGESSGYSNNLHEYLMTIGVDSDLVPPYELKTIVNSVKKTDRHDAAELAKFLRLKDKGEISLNMSYTVIGDDRKLRELCRYREVVARNKGDIAKSIQGHMRSNNQVLDKEFSDISTNKTREKIRLEFGEDFILMSMLDDYVYNLSRAEKIDKMFESEEYDCKEVELLQSIPGVGRLTAVELKSMIVDISRFETADKMRAYYGMAPKVSDSGESVHHGHITKRGDPMMRLILGRILNVFIQYHPNDNVAVYYRTHQDTSRKGVARIAAMNKILNIIFSILKRGTPYISE